MGGMGQEGILRGGPGGLGSGGSMGVKKATSTSNVSNLIGAGTVSTSTIRVNLQKNKIPTQEVHPNPRHASLASNAASPPTATDSRWISSLRRRDPELQPTLPSINHSNHHSTSSLTQQHSIGYTSSSNTPNTDRRSSRTSGQKSSLRKSRSVERIRARKLATSKVKERPKKSSSEEGGASDDQEVTSVEENSPQQQHSPVKRLEKQKLFSPIGYEPHLIDTLEKDMLQHPWDIDEAFRRRFEKRVYIGLPNDNTRKALLELCLKGVNISPDLNTDTITEQLNGYTGSDIANVCRDAAMMAMRRHINGLSPSEIKMIRREEVDLPVTAQDFQDAMVKTRKSVSANDVARYETWMDEYGSC
uniref:AAA ATPase AAA+ lid domain-containing protein n=1 Tax=Anopheles gambiae TaxID=7165 RepID=A0A1S4GHJ2_ANOGA